MRLLLDTNVFITLVEGRLSGQAREIIINPEAVLHVSVACLWEVAIKSRLGKLALKAPLMRLPELIENMGLVLLRIEAPHVLAAVDPEPGTRDPF
jgi:PIN domain nuclease of toxin-antitoxin system